MHCVIKFYEDNMPLKYVFLDLKKDARRCLFKIRSFNRSIFSTLYSRLSIIETLNRFGKKVLQFIEDN